MRKKKLYNYPLGEKPPINEFEMHDILQFVEKHKDDNSALGDLCYDLNRDRYFPLETNVEYVFEYLDYRREGRDYLNDSVRSFKNAIRARLRYKRQAIKNKAEKAKTFPHYWL